jgi:hypothetical protein
VTEDPNKRVALRIVVGDQEREVTFDELCLSNNLAQEALVRLLIKKNLFKPEELGQAIEQVRRERYRNPGDPSPSK